MATGSMEELNGVTVGIFGFASDGAGDSILMKNPEWDNRNIQK